MDQINADEMLDDIKVQWVGDTVILWHGQKLLTQLDARNVIPKIVNWCRKNHYRCTQVRDGKIWL